jgi:hypothetical protein
LQDFVGERLGPVVAQLEAATPGQWRHGFVPFEAFRKEISTDQALTAKQRTALVAVDYTVEFYRYETSAQCARYDGVEGTGVGMTMFYTDLLGKLWMDLDYSYSAPLRAIPGFLTAPRVNFSRTFAAEKEYLREGRLWFGHRADGWSRTTAGSAQEFAFVHRFNRLYTESWDPTVRGNALSPAEWARMTSNWWDRHFEEIADREQQYHRQNQIMKWSVATATMLDMPQAPRFLTSIVVDRTSQFFPWFAAHADELSFNEPLPERRTPYRTECLPLLASYEHSAGGDSHSLLIGGGVSLAGPKVVRNPPTVQPKLPPGQRVVPPAIASPGPRRALEGRTVAIKNAEATVTRASQGPLNVPGVSARFDASAGTRAITLNSGAGKLSTVTLARTPGGVRIEMQAGPVEKARAALTSDKFDASLSFGRDPDRVWLRDRAWLEVRFADRPSPDGTVTVVANDAPRPGVYQARAADAAAVQRRMDGYASQVVAPGSSPGQETLVHFSNDAPPVDAREIQVRGVQGVTTARVTEDGMLYFARPANNQRAGWRGIAQRAAEDPVAFEGAASSKRLDLSPRSLRSAEQLARTGRLEDAAPQLERHLAPQPKTPADRIREILHDLGFGKTAAARTKLDALLAGGTPLSGENRGLLVQSLRNHGDLGASRLVELEALGARVPPEWSLLADRGRVVVRYEARRIELVEVDPAQLDRADSISYFDSRLIVGREGFEPDFGGSITRWAQEPSSRVREMKMQPVELSPGVRLDLVPDVVIDKATGHELRMLRPSGRAASWPPGRIYVVEPRDGHSDCEKNRTDTGTARGSGSGSAQDDDIDCNPVENGAVKRCAPGTAGTDCPHGN